MEKWKNARKQARDFAQRARQQFQGGLLRCSQLLQNEYALRIANGEDVDQNAFTNECFRMFSKWPDLDDVHSWSTAKGKADRAVEACTRRLADSIRRPEDKG